MNKREEFDKIAREIFFPIHEVIAKDVLKWRERPAAHAWMWAAGAGTWVKKPPGAVRI